jgi:hypothetical protein
MTRRTHGHARIAVEKNIAVDVFDPDTFAALGDKFEVRPRIGRIDEFRVGFDDGATFGAGQFGLDFWSLQKGGGTHHFYAPGWLKTKKSTLKFSA